MISLYVRYCLLSRQNIATLVIIGFHALILFSGCKKKEDTSPPFVHIVSPSAGSVYYFNYALFIEAHVSDNQKLESITIDITNSSNQQFLQTTTWTDQGTDAEVSTTMQHDDLYLNSGVYYVRVTASDGENTTVQYQEIQLYAAPRVVQKRFAITDNGGGISIDSLYNSQLYQLIEIPDATFGFGGVDSRTNEICLLGSNPLFAALWPYVDFTIVPGTDITSIITGEITAFVHDPSDHGFYLGCSDGKLFRAGNGSIQLVAEFGDVAVEHLITTDTWIYCITGTGQIGNRYMRMLNKTTGNFIQALPLAIDLIGLAAMDDEDKVLLIGNEMGNSLFEYYNANTNAINNVFSFYDATPVTGVWHAADGNLYIAHASGIGYYTNNMNSYSINSSLIPDKMVWDEISGSVYAIASDGIHLLSQDCSSEISFFPGTNIRDVWVKYNK